jgi:two-component system response regulator GlrR
MTQDRKKEESLGSILVVDDNRNFLEMIKMQLEAANYNVSTASTEEETIERIKNQRPDLSIVDFQLVNQNGISLMQQIHAIAPEMPVIILTGYGSIENAVEAMRSGAYSYITKPFNHHDMFMQIERALERAPLTSEIKMLQGLLEERVDFPSIIATSDKMQRLLGFVWQIAKTDSTVFIEGESGTGKELIAKALHFASKRKDGAFVGINCAALPETLLESELFGHEKGAFTGALQKKKGILLQANGGTFFLDEVGDMPLAIQAKLLRFLQERQFYPVGGEKAIDVDVRLIVATNKDLQEQVRQGQFREDLFYRIHVIPVHVPALRERREDIPFLAKHFLKRFSEQTDKPVEDFTLGAMQKLMLYDWPGNVRELENTVECAAAMARKNMITEELILQTNGVPSEGHAKSLREAKEELERKYLIRTLEACGGNVSRTARMAGKHRTDVYNLLRRHGLRPVDFRDFRKVRQS